MQSIASAFGVEISPNNFKALMKENVVFRDLSVQKVPPLFSKIDKLLIDENYATTSNTKSSTNDSTNANKAQNLAAQKIAGQQIDGVTTLQDLQNQISQNQISIDDFAKIEIKIGEILSCTPVPKSSKLLRLNIDLGESSPRVVLSGIAQFYDAQELIGKQVCVVANLKPAKLMGELSYGMILASKDENGLSLLGIDKKRKNGSKVS